MQLNTNIFIDEQIKENSPITYNNIMKELLDLDELNQESQYKLPLQNIITTLKLSNFSEVVQWSDEVCTVISVNEFKQSVLPKLNNVDSLRSFLRILKKFNVKSRKSGAKLVIDFREIGNKKVYSKKIMKYLDDIDTKNMKICEKFRNIGDKLQNVIKTNEQIKKILSNKANALTGIEIFDYYKELIPLKIQKKLQKNIIF